MNLDGTAIRCTCCGREKLGEIHTCQGIEIRDRRHGEHHVAVLSPKDVLERLSGTFAPDAIIAYVRRVL